MQAAKKETVFEFPEGGIADFYMTDEQFAELERREQVGHGGIANIHHIADRIAEYGRYGDDTLAHVETGELIVPKALLEKNPALKESILEHLEELGVEDPERYIVGSEFNSLNPDTQLPEFFFKKLFKKAKKAFKKVVKGVKKHLKKIGKILKKASAVVLPVVLNAVFPGMGAIMTGALSGGISTLLQGGDLKDALKGAALGGVTGAVAKGGFNKLTGKSGFLDTIKTEVTDLGNLKSQFSTAGGILDPARYAATPATAAPATAAPAAGAQAAPVTQAPLPEIQGPPTAPPMQTVQTFDQFVNDAVGKGYSIDEFGNEYFNNQLIPKGGVATPDGTVIELAAQTSAEQGIVPTPGFEESVQAAIDRAQPAPPSTLRPMPRPDIAASSPQLVGPSAEQLAAEYAPKFTPVEDLIKTQIPTDLAGQGAGSAASSAVTPYTPREILPTMKDIVTGGKTGGFTGRLDATKELFFPSGPTATEVTAAQAARYNEALAQTGSKEFALNAAKGVTASSLSPSMLSTYGPALAATGLAAQQAGFFETPTYDPVTLMELEESYGGKTAEELIKMDPSKYRIDNLGRPVIIDQTLVPSTTAPPMTTMPGETPQYYRQGGQAFPRRTGGIDPSEGVPNQDSVRAMLMPGEFVMTTKAVRGMSRNGDSREGIRNMYSMMRNLEARERKMG